MSLDCADPRAEAEFWAALLDGDVIFSTNSAVGVRSEPIRLTAIQVDGYSPPSWPADDVPKQIHLDVEVTDLEASVARALRLGARLATHQPAPDRWRVLLDPAGHPFCLTTQVPDETP